MPPGSPPDSRPAFALDENFPEPLLLEIVEAHTPELDLRHVRRIDERLLRLVDDRLILALHQLGIEGLVTNDDRILARPEVLAMIEQTRLTVVTCRRTGHDALVATGLLLVHLGRIGGRHTPLRPQVWRLTGPERREEDFGKLTLEVERRTRQRVADYRLSPADLQTPVL